MAGSGWLARQMTDSTAGKFVHGACGLAWGLVAATCSAAYTLAYARQGRKAEAAAELVGLAVGFVGGGAISKVGVKLDKPWQRAVARNAGSVTRRQIRHYDRAFAGVSYGYSTAASYTASNWTASAYTRRFG